MSDLDPVIHAPVRLRIMTTLATLGEGDSMTFPRLRELLGVTAGNLSTHLTKLAEAGYITQAKGHKRKIPVTTITPTPAGRAAYASYRALLMALLAGE